MSLTTSESKMLQSTLAKCTKTADATEELLRKIAEGGNVTDLDAGIALHAGVMATEDQLGHVKIDGETIILNEDGAIKANFESEATVHKAGLFSAADKLKLDEIAPHAEPNVIDGIKGSAETSYRTGKVNIAPRDLGLGNVDNTRDIEKHVDSANKLAKAVNIRLDGGATSTDTPFDGGGDAVINVTGVDGDKVNSGVVDPKYGGTGVTKVDDIQAGKDNKGNIITETYATKREVENSNTDIYNRVQELIRQAITTGQLDADNYVTKEEHNTLDELVHKIAIIVLDEDFISALKNMDLSDYATIEYVNDRISEIGIPSIDLSDYATKEYVDDAIANLDTNSGGGEYTLPTNIATTDMLVDYSLLDQTISDASITNNTITFTYANGNTKTIDVPGGGSTNPDDPDDPDPGLVIPSASNKIPLESTGDGSAGTNSTYSRSDHVHPAPGALKTPRALAVSLKSAYDSTKPITFNGSADQINIPVTGILPEANGGTGTNKLSNLKIGKATEADKATKDANGKTIHTSYQRQGGVTLYLDISGNDSNDGLSAAKPLKTLAKALTLAAQYNGKSQIHIAAGTYTESKTINLYKDLYAEIILDGNVIFSALPKIYMCKGLLTIGTRNFNLTFKHASFEFQVFNFSRLNITHSLEEGKAVSTTNNKVDMYYLNVGGHAEFNLGASVSLTVHKGIALDLNSYATISGKLVLNNCNIETTQNSTLKLGATGIVTGAKDLKISRCSVGLIYGQLTCKHVGCGTESTLYIDEKGQIIIDGNNSDASAFGLEAATCLVHGQITIKDNTNKAKYAFYIRDGATLWFKSTTVDGKTYYPKLVFTSAKFTNCTFYVSVNSYLYLKGLYHGSTCTITTSTEKTNISIPKKYSVNYCSTINMGDVPAKKIPGTADGATGKNSAYVL